MAKLDLGALAQELGATLKTAPATGSSTERPYRAHVFPRYPAPVLIQSNGFSLGLMNYGLIPSFEKNLKPKMVFHNARIETISEKPSFREAFIKRHCLIPIESFFEYVDSSGPRKTLLEFTAKDGQRLFAAGVFQAWRPNSETTEWTFSMITREPTPQIQDAGHDRSPYFVDFNRATSGAAAWLQPMKGDSTPLAAPELHALLKQIAIAPELRIREAQRS